MPARILVIEDNPTNGELMIKLLSAFGYTTAVALNGAEGIANIEQEQPDLVICDLQLPVLDGYAVARHLKAEPRLRAIPLMAVTALAMVGDRDKAVAAGFDRYIPKPIDPKTFVEEVASLLPPTLRAPFRSPMGRGEAKAPPVAHRATILVIDNTYENIRVVRSQLERLGYRIIAASDIDQALNNVRRHHCDLILSDVHLGGASGYDFIKVVKADPQLQSLPFVFISSTSWMETDIAYAMSLGATAFITRPIELESLIRIVESCLKALPS